MFYPVKSLKAIKLPSVKAWKIHLTWQKTISEIDFDLLIPPAQFCITLIIIMFRSSVSVHIGVGSGSIEQSAWSPISWWQTACGSGCLLVVFASRFVFFIIVVCCLLLFVFVLLSWFWWVLPFSVFCFESILISGVILSLIVALLWVLAMRWNPFVWQHHPGISTIAIRLAPTHLALTC